MAQTSIEWANMVWNPVTGCSKVSAGCKHCYAETVFKRFGSKMGEFTNVTCHADRLEIPFNWKKPQRIFVNSISDLFHENVPFKFIHQVFIVIALNPQHTFLILTKRPERMRAYFNEYYLGLGDMRQMDEAAMNYHHRLYGNDGKLIRSLIEAGWIIDIFKDECGTDTCFYYEHEAPLPNVWLGISAESQIPYDVRMLALNDVPAAVRWVSAEPLLGPIDFRFEKNAVNWVVAGGESGAGARAMTAWWPMDIKEQCQEANVSFFFKQWGAFDECGKRVGKKKSGRLLGGQLFNEFPK